MKINKEKKTMTNYEQREEAILERLKKTFEEHSEIDMNKLIETDAETYYAIMNALSEFAVKINLKNSFEA
jgi:formiminotetrahydrofolate cyclodeaminase